MKVLEIYNSSDYDKIKFRGQFISKVMDDFFSKLPLECRVNYDKSLKNL